MFNVNCGQEAKGGRCPPLGSRDPRHFLVVRGRSRPRISEETFPASRIPAPEEQHDGCRPAPARAVNNAHFVTPATGGRATDAKKEVLGGDQ